MPVCCVPKKSISEGIGLLCTWHLNMVKGLDRGDLRRFWVLCTKPLCWTISLDFNQGNLFKIDSSHQANVHPCRGRATTQQPVPNSTQINRKTMFLQTPIFCSDSLLADFLQILYGIVPDVTFMFSYHPVRNGALLSNCLLGIPCELQHLMKFISPRKSRRENRVFLGRARDAVDRP